MEETKEAVNFLSNLQDFLLYDDQSRWQAFGWIIGITGALGTIDLVAIGASVEDTVYLMGAIILLMSFTWIAWYCAFRQQKRPARAPFMSRRTLVWQGASFIAFLVSLRLLRSETRIVDRRLQEASTNPASPQSIQETTQILASAKAAGVRIAPATLQSAGKKFIEASGTSPDVWNAALAFVDYRSSLNSNPPIAGFYPLGTGVRDPAYPDFEITYYDWGTIPGKTRPEFTTSIRRVPIAVSARGEKIGVPIKQEAHEGPELLLGVGGELKLDGTYMRGVVLESVTIHYSGGPLIMENVTFVNCQFVIDNVENGRALSSNLLASSAVSFKIQPL
jgi:hypothetical protein